MYAGRVECCPLESHVEYTPCVLLKLEKRRNRQTDRRTPDRYITLTAIDAAGVIIRDVNHGMQRNHRIIND